MTPFLAFPAEVRRVIYTTNAIEALNRQLRKAIKTKGSFPNEDAARKLVYLALQNATPQWTRTRNESVKPRRSDSDGFGAECACRGAGCCARGRVAAERDRWRNRGTDRAARAVAGVRDRRRVAASFAAGCQLALGLRVGVVDPRAKRRFWD